MPDATQPLLARSQVPQRRKCVRSDLKLASFVDHVQAFTDELEISTDLLQCLVVGINVDPFDVGVAAGHFPAPGA